MGRSFCFYACMQPLEVEYHPGAFRDNSRQNPKWLRTERTQQARITQKEHPAILVGITLDYFFVCVISHTKKESSALGWGGGIRPHGWGWGSFPRPPQGLGWGAYSPLPLWVGLESPIPPWLGLGGPFPTPLWLGLGGPTPPWVGWGWGG